MKVRHSYYFLCIFIFVKIVKSVWLLLSTFVSPWLCCLESLRTAQQETLRVSMESTANYGNKFSKVSGLISIHLVKNYFNLFYTINLKDLSHCSSLILGSAIAPVSKTSMVASLSHAREIRRRK